MQIKSYRHELIKDILLILFSIVIVVLLSISGKVELLLHVLGNGYLASFITGFFFTSIFTIAPATFAFIQIATVIPKEGIIIFGSLGAVCGDLILFFFIRDKFFIDLKGSIKPSFRKHFLSSFHLGFLKWLSPILGFIAIVSPLPDEVAMTLLGISKIKMVYLVPLIFITNIIAISGLLWVVSII